jgi:hypothetical protein
MQIKKLLVAFVVAALIAVGVVGPANAQTTVGDGLVNVAVGDVTILKNVNIAVAADVVAQVCGLDVDVVAGVIADIDQGDTGQTTFCRTDDGPVKVRQNAGRR